MIVTLVRYWGPVCAYAGLIFYLSSLSFPEERLPSFLTDVSDKVLHAVEYAGLGALLYRALRWGTNDTWAPHAIWLAIILASGYGVTDEIHQWFVPFRESTWQDWAADSLGGAIGAWVMHRMTLQSPSAKRTDPSPVFVTRR